LLYFNVYQRNDGRGNDTSTERFFMSRDIHVIVLSGICPPSDRDNKKVLNLNG